MTLADAANLKLEVIGQMSLGSDMGQQVGDVAESRLSRADNALQHGGIHSPSRIPPNQKEATCKPQADTERQSKNHRAKQNAEGTMRIEDEIGRKV